MKGCNLFWQNFVDPAICLHLFINESFKQDHIRLWLWQQKWSFVFFEKRIRLFLRETSSSLGRWCSPSRPSMALSSASSTCVCWQRRRTTTYEAYFTIYITATSVIIQTKDQVIVSCQKWWRKVYLKALQHGKLRWQPQQLIRGEVDVSHQEKLIKVTQGRQALLYERKTKT